MPEARDRLVRQEDISEVYGRWRRSVGTSSGGGSGNGGRIGISAVVPQEVTAARTPFRWGATPMTAARFTMGVAAGSGVGRTSDLGTPRNGRGRNLHGSPVTGTGLQNVFLGSGRGRGRGRGSVLPSWYPRTPLRDITVVMRAIERRRARLGEGEGQNTESLLPQERTVVHPSVSTSGAQPEHDVSLISPSPTIGRKPGPLSVEKLPKILLDIANQDSEESSFLTPQKKLLNAIDTKVVMEELRNLKRTPTAKKAEREKKVRTLMSMR